MNKLVIAGTLATALLQAGANAAVGVENFAVRTQVLPQRFFNPYAYSVQVLPLDTASAMGDGIIVGTANGIAVAYVNGQMTPLPGKAGYTNVQPTAVSSNGYIVGYANSGNNVRGLFWSSYTNAPMDMGALGAVTMPFGVNSQGVVVGSMRQSSILDPPTAFAWSISGGMRSIAPTSSTDSEAYDISDSGYVAGYANFDVDLGAIRWYPGTFTAGVAGYGSAAHKAMENGTIFGDTVAWDLNDQAQVIAPSSATIVQAISAAGRKVGSNLYPPNQAWTVAPNSTTVQILPVPSGVVGSYAIAVTGCGAILGWVSYPDGSTKAVLWTKLTCDQAPVLQ